MHWTEKYLCPLIERDRFTWKRVKSVIKDFKELMIHALSFHKQPKGPLEKLPEFKTDDKEIIYTVCKEFYDNANDRIDKLEDKAIKLLSYITALFAFISFAFINTQFVVTKVMLITSMVSLILAIIISFRCVNVKGRKSFFIPDIYDFRSNVPKESFDKKNISRKLLNSAIYNQNVADNTADILRAARYALAVSIAISIIGFLVGATSYFKVPSQITKVKIENQVELNEIERKLDNTNKSINELNDNVRELNDSKKLQEQINKLEDELKVYKSNYDDLSKRLDKIDQK